MPLTKAGVAKKVATIYSGPEQMRVHGQMLNEEQLKWVFIGAGLPGLILIAGGVYLNWRDKRQKLRDKAPRRGSRAKKKASRRR